MGKWKVLMENIQGCAYPLDIRDQETINQYAKSSFESNNNK